MPQLIVLVVDDDALLRSTIREALGADGIEPVVASSGDALRRIREGPTPDAVVIDLDGREGSALLAELGCGLADLVPVVALSSRPRRLVAAGFAEAVLVKPFEVAQLRRCVARACDEPRGAI